MVIKCPECNHFVSDTSTTCPHCGYVLKKGEAEPPKASNPEPAPVAPQPEPAPVAPQSEPAPVAPQPEPALVAPQPEPVPVAPQPEPATVVPQPEPATVVPQPIEYQQAEKSNVTLYAIIAALALLICGVGGYLYYNNVYLPEKIDREAPRYYTMADMMVLRSSRSAGADYNKIGSLPYGTELITYELDSEWARVKVSTPNAGGDKLEGYVARPFILDKHDFFLLNSIFGDQQSRETISTTKCRMALLEYFKTHGYIGVIDNQIRTEAGINTIPDGENQWQVFCKLKEAKPNSVLYKRLYDRNSKFTDFAVIIKNISNDNRKLLYFYFDEDETPHLFTEQDAPKEGYIVDGKIVYDRYSGENKLEFIYSY